MDVLVGNSSSPRSWSMKHLAIVHCFIHFQHCIMYLCLLFLHVLVTFFISIFISSFAARLFSPLLSLFVSADIFVIFMASLKLYESRSPHQILLFSSRKIAELIMFFATSILLESPSSRLLLTRLAQGIDY